MPGGCRQAVWCLRVCSWSAGERYGPQPSYGSSGGGAESGARPERAPRPAPAPPAPWLGYCGGRLLCVCGQGLVGCSAPEAPAEEPPPEAAAAGATLGVENITLDIHDAALEPSLANRHQVIAVIREFQPDLVMVHRPNDYHPDHRYVGVLVQDAGDEGLIRHPFLKGALLQLAQIPRRNADIDTGILGKGFGSNLSVLPNLGPSLRNALQIAALKGLQNLFLFAVKRFHRTHLHTASWLCDSE